MYQFVTKLTNIKDSNDIASNVEIFIKNLSKFKSQVKNIGIAMFHSLINLSQESPHIQILLDGAKNYQMSLTQLAVMIIQKNIVLLCFMISTSCK